MTLRAVAQSGATLQTNGVNNSSQVLLNLAAGSGATLSEAGGTVTISAVSPADILAADAPGTSFDITNGGAGGAVTILSKSITGISAKDQIIIELECTVLNNSGGTVTLTFGGALGTFTFSAADQANSTGSNATSRNVRTVRIVWGVTSSSLTNLRAQTGWVAAPLAAGTAGALAVQGSRSLWDTSASDFTGTQTATVTISSSSATATQTLFLIAYTIRKIPSNP